MDVERATIQCLALFETPQTLAKIITEAEAQGRSLTVAECFRVLRVHQAAGEVFAAAIRSDHPYPPETYLIPDGT